MKRSRDGAELSVDGVIDETADLSFIGDIHGRTRLELGGLRRINSHGVRLWMRAMAQLPGDADVELHHCSPAFVDQMNLVHGFCGRFRVISILVPYVCDRCDDEVDLPVGVDECRHERKFPTDRQCADCGGELLPNEVESIYLRFLEHTG